MFETTVLFTVVLLICYLLAFFADKSYKRTHQIICIALIIIVLSLLSGLRRYDIGIDTPNYVSYFLYGFRNYQGIEPGYKFLSTFLMSIYPSYTFGLTCIAFIINTLFIIRFWSLREISPFRYSLAIYYCMIYLLTFSGIRQWLAVSIVFFATKYVYDNRKLVVAFILVTIAFFLHNSVIIALFLFVPYIFEKSNSLKISLFQLVLFVLGPIIGYLTYSLLMSNYSDFITDYAKDSVSVGLMIPARLLLLFLLFFFDYPRTKAITSVISNDSDSVPNKIDVKKLLLFETVNLVLNSMGMFVNNTSRICWYYWAFTPILYGRSLNKRIGKNSIYLLIKIFIIVVFIYYFYTSISSQTNNLVPYHFYWD